MRKEDFVSPSHGTGDDEERENGRRIFSWEVCTPSFAIPKRKDIFSYSLCIQKKRNIFSVKWDIGHRNARACANASAVLVLSRKWFCTRYRWMFAQIICRLALLERILRTKPATHQTHWERRIKTAPIIVAPVFWGVQRKSLVNGFLARSHYSSFLGFYLVHSRFIDIISNNNKENAAALVDRSCVFSWIYGPQSTHAATGVFRMLLCSAAVRFVSAFQVLSQRSLSSWCVTMTKGNRAMGAVYGYKGTFLIRNGTCGDKQPVSWLARGQIGILFFRSTMIKVECEYASENASGHVNFQFFKEGSAAGFDSHSQAVFSCS